MHNAEAMMGVVLECLGGNGQYPEFLRLGEATAGEIVVIRGGGARKLGVVDLRYAKIVSQ